MFTLLAVIVTFIFAHKLGWDASRKEDTGRFKKLIALVHSYEALCVKLIKEKELTTELTEQEIWLKNQLQNLEKEIK
jgi:hypothetical protein